MARMWLWFNVAVLIQIVCAYEINQNCDQCMRKGNTWCKEPGNAHCSLATTPDDDWCSSHREPMPSIYSSGSGQQPLLKERRLYIDTPGQLEINYESPYKLQVNVSLVNSTQSRNIAVSVHRNECDGVKCVVTIQATPGWDFCKSTGGVYEYAHAKVAIENKTDVTIKYHVACACMCSQDVEKESLKCNLRGDLSCGMCSCYDGWSGQFCEVKIQPSGSNKGGNPTKGGSPTKGGNSNGGYPVSGKPPVFIPVTDNGACTTEMKSPKCNFRGNYNCGNCQCYEGWSGEICDKQICEGKRGDIQCTNPKRDYVECSGNGYCGPCDKCVCYNDREGSQYFDEDEYCTDLCLETSTCDHCLLNNTLGECGDCNLPMTRVPYNASLTEIKDTFNRRVWVRCNETVVDCAVTYWAMRDENNEITYMVQETCNDVMVEKSTAGPKVPIIVSVLALIAAVAAVGGILAWKHFSAVPPLPLSDPEYQNIDAEDCTGENPLYKSPMSSFKNPTYGKW